MKTSKKKRKNESKEQSSAQRQRLSIPLDDSKGPAAEPQNQSQARISDQILQETFETPAFKAKKLKDDKEWETKVGDLGEIASDYRNYFRLSSRADGCAIKFLISWWEDPANVKGVEDFYRKKTGGSSIKPDPNCLSFIPIEINGESQKFCLVALSGTTYKALDLRKKLAEFIKKYNEENKPEYPLVLLGNVQNNDPEQINIDDLIKRISEELGIRLRDSKDCAEKAYSTELLKLFAIQGKNLRVVGVANCRFYPYIKNQRPSDMLVKPPQEKTEKIFEKENKQYEYCTIDCCQSCQDNKPAILSLYCGAQLYAEKNRNSNKPVVYKLCLEDPTSPVSQALTLQVLGGKYIESLKLSTKEIKEVESLIKLFNAIVRDSLYQNLDTLIKKIEQKKVSVAVKKEVFHRAIQMVYQKLREKKELSSENKKYDEANSKILAGLWAAQIKLLLKSSDSSYYWTYELINDLSYLHSSGLEQLRNYIQSLSKESLEPQNSVLVHCLDAMIQKNLLKAYIEVADAKHFKALWEKVPPGEQSILKAELLLLVNKMSTPQETKGKKGKLTSSMTKDNTIKALLEVTPDPDPAALPTLQGLNTEALFFLGAEGGDYTLASQQGLRRTNWYSITDMYSLTMVMRQNTLNYRTPSGGEYTKPGQEAASSYRQNRQGIFIADPYTHFDKCTFAQCLQEDISVITGTHKQQNRWHRWAQMPTRLFFPFWYHNHWQLIAVEIDYDRKQYHIRYDDPFGGSQFGEYLSAIEAAVKVLAKTHQALKDQGAQAKTKEKKSEEKEFEFKLMPGTPVIKTLDQQGRGINGYDCGPIMVQNLQDYVSSGKSLSDWKDTDYTVPAATTPGWEGTMRRIRKSHNAIVQGAAASSSVAERLAIQKKSLTEEQEKQKKASLQEAKSMDLVLKISLLSPAQLDQLFSVAAHQRRIKNESASGDYTTAELSASYNLLFLQPSSAKPLTLWELFDQYNLEYPRYALKDAKMLEPLENEIKQKISESYDPIQKPGEIISRKAILEDKQDKTPAEALELKILKTFELALTARAEEKTLPEPPPPSGSAGGVLSQEASGGTPAPLTDLFKPKFDLAAAPRHAIEQKKMAEIKRLLPLQDELVAACERGDIKAVQAAIEKGAKPFYADSRGKQPLGAAVWGMSLQAVNYLLERMGDVKPMSWEECQQHNLKVYKNLFIIPEGKPQTFINWNVLTPAVQSNLEIHALFAKQSGIRLFNSSLQDTTSKIEKELMGCRKSIISSVMAATKAHSTTATVVPRSGL